jgi:hypothetical protein
MDQQLNLFRLLICIIPPVVFSSFVSAAATQTVNIFNHRHPASPDVLRAVITNKRYSQPRLALCVRRFHLLGLYPGGTVSSNNADLVARRHRLACQNLRGGRCDRTVNADRVPSPAQPVSDRISLAGLSVDCRSSSFRR